MSNSFEFLVKEDKFDRKIALLALNLAKRYLNGKQREILRYLTSNDSKTSTRIVKELSSSLNCSQSTLWYNINSLKSIGLLNCKKGKSIGLTKAGVFIAKAFENQEESR
jgi:DNA-binding MarR family transcriptional regulator